MVSSTLGSPTNTGWKRRASAASFSTCLRYSSSVVAPTQCSAPRASAGLIRLEASIAPSARPAPTSVCISSMNRMTSPCGGLDLLQHRLQPLLELAAVFRAGDHRAQVERQQLLVLQRLRHVAVDDAQRQALDDGGLADAGLADQHRVVLGAAGEHLDGAADFLVAADHRVELALPRQRGDVAGVFLQRVEVGLGVLAGDLAALADVVDRLLQRLRGRAGATQRRAGRRVAGGERQQQPVLRDVFVAGLLGRLLGGVEHADQVGGELRLAGAVALHLGLVRQLGSTAGRPACGSPPAA